MPFPGSQDTETIQLAYSLEKIIPSSQVIGILILAIPVLHSFFYGTFIKRIGNGLWCILIIILHHYTDSVYSAEVMFKEPVVKNFQPGSSNIVSPENIIIGVENNGEEKAYPINYIGYHHKVQDTVGGKPVLITYCTMCRTARIYSPLVNGKYQRFRLVGARHYDAVIEDEETKSWWYQASGEAAAGPLKGKFLEQLPFEQMTLKTWLLKHPNSLIMQPDSNFANDYADLKEYDTKMRADSDSLWQRKSWVIGVAIDGNARAYEWKDVLKQKLINDTLANEPIMIYINSDKNSFNVWSRKINGMKLFFVPANDTLPGHFIETSSQSLWNKTGECSEGSYKGQKLKSIQAYQQYWHSWKHFHPNTSQWSGQ
jgi:hypothetical protein